MVYLWNRQLQSIQALVMPVRQSVRRFQTLDYFIGAERAISS
jgi:hypothetical protein